jgi:outer membrane receptor protein involved in Fe transport
MKRNAARHTDSGVAYDVRPTDARRRDRSPCPATAVAAVLATGVAGTLAPALAHAQTATPRAVADSRLEDVVVTAQRREQSVQDVGIAVTAVTGEQLADRGITSINDLERLAPSLNVIPQFGGGQAQFIIRGVGFADYATLNSPTVGVYLDEVAFPLPVMTQGQLFDVQRVEVLRGPQGTLYGRNTTGGAVNFVTNRPTDEFSAGITAEAGNYDHVRAEGFVSGPLGDELRVRLAAVTQQGGAWRRNRVRGEKLGDADQTAVRAIAEWQATENFTAALTLRYGQNRGDGAGAYLLGRQSTRLPGVPALPADADPRNTGWGTSAAFAQLLGITPTTKPFRDDDQFAASLRLDWNVGFGRLTSLTSHETMDRREYDDWDGSANALSEVWFASDIAVTQQELRLASNDDAALQWVAGFYYSKEELDEEYWSNFTDSLGLYAQTPYSSRAETASVFGQLEYRLTDALNLVFGLRYEDESRELRGLSTRGVVPVSPPVVIPFVTNADRDTDMQEVSGKAGLEYRVTPDVLLYGTVSRGVKSGGFTAYNTTANLPPSNPADPLRPFEPEVLWSYEAGLKGEFADGRVQLSAAAFWYDYRDQQVLSVVVDPVNGPIGRIVNAPKSEIYGGEFELLAQPTDGLRLRAALAYSEGTYREFQDVDVAASSVGPPYRTVPLDRSGEDLDFPNLTFNGSIAYAIPLAGYTLEPELAYSYRDELTSVLVSPTRGRIYDVGAYGLLDARLTLQPASGGPWSVTLYGRNLADEEYDVTRNFFLPDNSIGIAGAPRTYGIRVSWGI